MCLRAWWDDKMFVLSSTDCTLTALCECRGSHSLSQGPYSLNPAQREQFEFMSSQLSCSGFQHFPWCDQDVLQVLLCLKLFIFDNSKGCQLRVLQTWNSHERFFKVPRCSDHVSFRHFIQDPCFWGLFVFFQACFFSVMSNFLGFHGKTPDF